MYNICILSSGLPRKYMKPRFLLKQCTQNKDLYILPFKIGVSIDMNEMQVHQNVNCKYFITIY